MRMNYQQGKRDIMRLKQKGFAGSGEQARFTSDSFRRAMGRMLLFLFAC